MSQLKSSSMIINDGTPQKRRPDLTPPRGRGPISARTIGALTPRVTKTVFQKFGFATAQLISDWPQIVGERLAATTAPDRIRWPRRPDDAPEANQSKVADNQPKTSGKTGGASSNGLAGPRSGATLVIRVEPALALDVQYKTAQILERINAYFGYRAVADLRIVQGAVSQPAPAPNPARQTASRRQPASAPVALSGIADDGLKAALERMQNGLRGRIG